MQDIDEAIDKALQAKKDKKAFPSVSVAMPLICWKD